MLSDGSSQYLSISLDRYSSAPYCFIEIKRHKILILLPVEHYSVFLVSVESDLVWIMKSLYFQSVYNRTFLRSRLQIQSGMGIATGNIINSLTPATCGEAMNLFLLPEIGEIGVVPLCYHSYKTTNVQCSSNVKHEFYCRRGWSLQRSSWFH